MHSEYQQNHAILECAIIHLINGYNYFGIYTPVVAVIYAITFHKLIKFAFKKINK